MKYNATLTRRGKQSIARAELFVSLISTLLMRYREVRLAKGGTSVRRVVLLRVLEQLALTFVAQSLWPPLRASE